MLVTVEHTGNVNGDAVKSSVENGTSPSGQVTQGNSTTNGYTEPGNTNPEYVSPSTSNGIETGTIQGSGKYVTSKDIKYTQDSISSKFSDGTTIEETINGLKNGTINPKSIPEIRIFEKNGQIFSLDNRRLYAFKEAGINDIPYRWATTEEIANEAWKMTTNNGGTSIRVR